MVGGDRRMGQKGGAVRRHQCGQEIPLPVQNGDVVTHMRRDAGQGATRLFDRGAGLKDVAQDQRHTEPVAHDPPPAKGQRHRKPGIVDPVHQPPETVRCPHDGAPLPACMQHDAFEGPRIVVVIAHQDGFLAGPDRLAASRQIGRRAVEAEEAGRQIAAARQRTKLFVKRQDFGHVGFKRPQTFAVGRARILPFPQPPCTVGGPMPVEKRGPFRAGPVFAYGPPPEVHYMILNAGSESAGPAAVIGKGSAEKADLIPWIHFSARSFSRNPLVIDRPRVTRMPRSAPS